MGSLKSDEESVGLFSRLSERIVRRCKLVADVVRRDKKGWFICLAVLIVTIVRSGITYSFGQIIVGLNSDYHKPLAEQNWIGTLSFCISLSCAPISVAFIRSLGHRGYRIAGLLGTLILTVSCLASSFVAVIEWMFLTHSILYGVGSSLIYMSSSLIIGEYFNKEHKYHVLATSILLCGYPVGSLLFNPVFAALVSQYDWRVPFRCASVLIAITGFPCCWFFTVNDTPAAERLIDDDELSVSTMDMTQTQLEQQQFEDDLQSKKLIPKCCTMEIIRQRPEIIFWYIGNCLSYIGFYMPFVNLAFYMEKKGIPQARSWSAVTLLSFAECVTYIIASFLGDYLKGVLVYVNVIAAAALALICFIWPLIDFTFGVILAIAIAMGGFLGLTIVYTYAASGEVTQLPIDVAWSCTNLWSGIGILVGPLFSGAIYDIRNNYNDMFYVDGVLYLVNTIIFAAIPYFQRKRSHTMRSDYNQIVGLSSVQQMPMRTVKVQRGSVDEDDDVTTSNGCSGNGYGTTNGKTPSTVTYK